MEAAGDSSMFSLDYYRGKIVEFQSVIDAMDGAATTIRATIDEDISPELTAALQDAIAQYDSRKSQFRAAAEAINFAVNGANIFGANLPAMRPGGLAALPLAALAGISAAVAAVAGLIVWGRDWIRGANERMRLAVQLGNLSPEARDRAILRQLELEAYRQQADASPLASIAGIVKWLAIGAIGYFAWQAYSKARG